MWPFFEVVGNRITHKGCIYTYPIKINVSTSQNYLGVYLKIDNNREGSVVGNDLSKEVGTP